MGGRWDGFPKAFWNDREHRPRTGVRLYFAPMSISIGIIVGIILLQGGRLVRDLLSVSVDQSLFLELIAALGEQVIGALAISGGLIAGAWFFGRRRISDLGLEWSRRWVEDFLFGLLLGLSLHTGILLLGIAVGWITVTNVLTAAAGREPALWFVYIFIFQLCVGLREEVIFRGFLLTNLAEAFNWFEHIDQSLAAWTAVGVTSVAFSLWHTDRPVTFLVLAGLLGVLFGTTYVLTGSIAIPIGFHTAWNMAVVRLYSSGTVPPAKLVEISVHGPTLAGLPFLELLDFMAVGVGLLVILGWVRVRDGALRARPEIAVPDLHDRRFKRTLGRLFEPDWRE